MFVVNCGIWPSPQQPNINHVHLFVSPFTAGGRAPTAQKSHWASSSCFWRSDTWNRQAILPESQLWLVKPICIHVYIYIYISNQSSYTSTTNWFPMGNPGVLPVLPPVFLDKSTFLVADPLRLQHRFGLTAIQHSRLAFRRNTRTWWVCFANKRGISWWDTCSRAYTNCDQNYDQ